MFLCIDAFHKTLNEKPYTLNVSQQNWSLLKHPIIFSAFVNFLSFFLLATRGDMWDLSSLTRNQTYTHGVGSTDLVV